MAFDIFILKHNVINIDILLLLDCPMPNDIYARLKYLEDRILFLESVSPEYITPGQNLLNNNVKQLREHDLEMSNISTDLTIDHTTLLNIEEKISALKKELTKS